MLGFSTLKFYPQLVWLQARALRLGLRWLRVIFARICGTDGADQTFSASRRLGFKRGMDGGQRLTFRPPR